MVPKVYRYTVDLQSPFDFLVWKNKLAIPFQPDQMRLAKKYGIESTYRLLKALPVEVEAVIMEPGQRMGEECASFRSALLIELIAFTCAFPEATWEDILLALGTDYYYGHADGRPKLVRTSEGRSLGIDWGFPLRPVSRLWVRKA